MASVESLPRGSRSLVTENLNIRQDHELLSGFVQHRDAVAFRQIVERHGTMVLGICHRVLRQKQDAEDACQAVFLILARKAEGIHKRESVASWLHGVAYRTAANLRRSEIRRRDRETAALMEHGKTGTMMGEPVARNPQPSDPVSQQELRLVLDEELARLPDELRAPLVLCYFEGRARDEAAAILGWPLSTLKGRLSQARDLLERRLTRRGLALSLVVSGMAVMTESAPAATLTTVMAAQITQAATQFAAGTGTGSGAVTATAAQLAERMITIMGLANPKLLAMSVLTASLLVSTSVLASYQALGAAPRTMATRVAAVTSTVQTAPKATVAAAPDSSPILDQSPSVAQATVIGSDADEMTSGPSGSPRFSPPPDTTRDREPATVRSESPRPATPEVPAPKPPQALPTVQVEGFQIRVQRCVTVDPRHVNIVPTGRPFLPAQADFTQTFASPDGNSTASVAGAAGGSAGVTQKPSLVVDLLIEPPANAKQKLIVEVAPRATAIDVQRHKLRSPELPGPLGWQIQPDNGLLLDRRDMVFLIQEQNESPATLLTQLTGELLLTEGQRSEFRFTEKDLRSKNPKGVLKKGDGISVALKSLRRTDDGVEMDLNVVLPQPGPSNQFVPAEQLLKQVWQMQPEITAELTDANGQTVTSQVMKSQLAGTGGMSQGVTMTFGGGTGGASGFRSGGISGGGTSGSGGAGGGFGRAGGNAGFQQGGAGGTSSNGGATAGQGAFAGGKLSGAPHLNQQSVLTLKFEALPPGVKLDCLKVWITRRTSDARAVPFVLQDIPVSQP